MRRDAYWAGTMAILCLLGVAQGCELIIGLDRIKPDDQAAGGGGAGAASQGGGGSGGTGGPYCVDPAKDCPAAPESKVAACDVGGTCIEDNDLEGKPCTNGGKVCNGSGKCVACNTDSDCDVTEFCDHTNVCIEDNATGQPCSKSSECASDSCVDGVCCDTACDAVCYSCNIMNSVGTCIAVPPEQTDDGCKAPQGCDGSGTCANVTGASCSMDSECTTGFCVDGVCCGSSCDGTCRACVSVKTGQPDGMCADITTGTDPDSECAGMLNCLAAGECDPKKTLGEPCSVEAECFLGYCTDGVCCGTKCSGICQACNSAGYVGTCRSYLAGTDPENECPGALNCSGGNMCQ